MEDIEMLEEEYDIDINYDKRIQDRLRTFQKVTKTKKTITLAFVTPNGLHDNMYSRKVRNQITADDLFK